MKIQVLILTVSVGLTTVCPCFAELNTHASSESYSEAGSMAGNNNGFPILGGAAESYGAGGVITSEPSSMPNPGFYKSRTPVKEKPAEHEVVGDVKNYTWPQK
ncbi:MAG: hypothetical protein K2W82_09655 [Candidatus Obscuribacterales bacterium]|nr:hypothetical protein [Candidatus Obscuribacterales bacterium]